jgi:hypothetical protein
VAVDRGTQRKKQGGALLWSALFLLSSCGSPDPGIRYCAVSQTISCYGNPGEPESICDETCALMPGTSSYDPKTECLTEYGPNHGAGSSCEQAIHDLEVNAVAPQDRCAASDNDTTCKACAKQSCCSTFAACQDDVACQALMYCLWPCGENDTECRDPCYGENPDGAELIDAYFTCFDASCATCAD